MAITRDTIDEKIEKKATRLEEDGNKMWREVPYLKQHNKTHGNISLIVTAIHGRI